MGLTSGSFTTLMIVVAVASVLAVVWLWPRLARGRLLSVAGRLGLIAASQVLVIAAFLVVFNGYFGFFGTWAELLGRAGSSQVVPVVRAGSLSRSVIITATDPGPLPGGKSLPRSGPSAAAAGPSLTGPAGHGSDSSPAQAGRLLMVSIIGRRTGISVAGDYVYLPPQYFQPAYARARFPVVLVMTGYPGSALAIVTRLGVPSTAARLVAARLATPAIYVMMNVSPVMPRDTECTNVPAGPQVESFFARDVPLAIEQAFRAQSSPGGWAAMGYSTGGLCATKLAMLNPRQFPSAVALAGYYKALRDHTTGNLYGGSNAYRNENDPYWRLQHLPDPPVSVLVTSSKIGEKTYPGALKFLSLVRPPMRAYSLFLPQGGHNFGSWTRELPQSLEWLSQRLTPAVPAGGQPFVRS
ncbi:MAG TPA: esterase [Actinobacteria bacterium]|nr:esterase [Actinomycetota bacterium]